MSTILLPTHGGYRRLYSFQKAEIIFDATVYFTRRFFRPDDRTIDQMVQAARSGKQNIAEASMASGTSKEMEIKLTNVARASLEEVLIDYEDFLRIRGFCLWGVKHPYTERLANPSYETFRKGIENDSSEICANVIIDLIKITTYLLNGQIRRLEQDFLREGGLRERMSQARRDSRKANP